MGDDLGEQAKRRLAEASRRAEELRALRDRLVAGKGVTHEDLAEAEARLDEARRHAEEARKRAAKAHQRAGRAHESAAAMSESMGDLESARRHRAAAAADFTAERADEEPEVG